MDGTNAAFAGDAVAERLPQVLHGQPGAVLLVQVSDGTVLFANPLAEQLAPGMRLPCPADDWSRRAGLETSAGDDITDPANDASPLSRIARGEPVHGERVTAARSSDMSREREALWVIGLPLSDAPVDQLSGLALVALLPLREEQMVADAKESAERLHSRAVLASDLSFTISDPNRPDNPLVWVNPAFEKVTGYARDDVLGENCRFLQGPDTDRAAVRRLRTALQTGETVTELLLNYRKDGTAFWNEVVISPVLNAEGEVTHFVGVQSDVTLRVQAERERDAALAVARDARHRLEFLSGVTDQLSEVLDPDAAQDLLPSLVVPEFAEWAFATMLDSSGRTRHIRASHASPSRAGDAARFQELQAGLNEGSISMRVLRGDLGPTLVSVEDEHVDAVTSTEAGALLRVLGLGSAIVVPLRARGQVTGSLTLLSGPDRPPFTEDDLATATDLGARAGVALENARLYAQQRRSSETLQLSLLTPPTTTPGLSVATRYIPAAEAAQVGGDWYDAFTQPDGSTVVVIGDVMGHDVSAAAAMGQLRTLVRALAYDRSAEPAEVVHRLDRLLDGLGLTTLATAVVLQFDGVDEAGERRIRWCTAGHLPPVAAAPDGAVRMLEGDGIVLGLGAEQERTQQSAVLQPGSTLLLYTDGLVERRDRSMEVRLAELRDVVASLAELDVETLCDELLARMLPGGSDDDVAIVAVRAEG
ncbi:SpoIIE family protein phosphatase [Kineococcus sp. SYSU DK003]|uniref:SpoIIE family protein phosphatase n=1 Tax=Kineococcus sp. SYSU DK003 TaxID=3383124 RepID=UPI003D7C831F